jgi:hypothetical protein
MCWAWFPSPQSSHLGALVSYFTFRIKIDLDKSSLHKQLAVSLQSNLSYQRSWRVVLSISSSLKRRTHRPNRARASDLRLLWGLGSAEMVALHMPSSDQSTIPPLFPWTLSIISPTIKPSSHPSGIARMILWVYVDIPGNTWLALSRTGDPKVADIPAAHGLALELIHQSQFIEGSINKKPKDKCYTD